MITTSGKSVIAVALVSSAVLGLLYFRDRQHSVRLTNNVVVIADKSDSTAAEDASTIGLVEESLKRPGLSQGSTLTVLTTGDDATANEPRLVARYDVPFSRRALEGKGSIVRRKAEILKNLQVRLSQLPRTERSPIFLAVKRGVEQLRGTGCRPESDCSLYIRTDAEELSERSIAGSIDSARNRKDFPAPIPNEGIRVLFCGLAETNDLRNDDTSRLRTAHSPKRGDRVREVWLSLFTATDLVTFEPYCPKGEMTQKAKR